MTFRMITVMMVGRQMGIITLVRYLKSEVPSTLAALYSSSGICSKFSFKR